MADLHRGCYYCKRFDDNTCDKNDWERKKKKCKTKKKIKEMKEELKEIDHFRNGEAFICGSNCGEFVKRGTFIFR